MFGFITILNWIYPQQTQQTIIHSTKKYYNMEVAVWDTYVKKKDGKTMHFDIIAPTSVKDEKVIHEYGKTYLKQKHQEGQPLTSKECRFCHIEKATDEMVASINKAGFYIIEMENCK